MKAVIQRVARASVSVDTQIIGEIKTGLLVFLGIARGDTAAEGEWLAQKVAGLRIFPDDAGQMNLSVREVGGDILIISQFTLIASTRKGNRPSFNDAAKPDLAVPLYETFLSQVAQALGRPIVAGRFGADMKVSLLNDGPVTIIIDTQEKA